MRAIRQAVEAGIASGEIDAEAVFDREYVQIEGTNPPQYNNGFADFADAHVRPLLDRFKARDDRVIGSAITNLDGYLPTSRTSQPTPGLSIVSNGDRSMMPRSM